MKRCFWKIVVSLALGVGGTLFVVAQSERMEPFIVEVSPKSDVDEAKLLGEVDKIETPSLSSSIENGEDPELEALKKEREKLMLENQL